MYYAGVCVFETRTHLFVVSSRLPLPGCDTLSPAHWEHQSCSCSWCSAGSRRSPWRCHSHRSHCTCSSCCLYYSVSIRQWGVGGRKGRWKSYEGKWRATYKTHSGRPFKRTNSSSEQTAPMDTIQSGDPNCNWDYTDNIHIHQILLLSEIFFFFTKLMN